MFCESCGEELKAGELYCPACGAKVRRVMPSPRPPTQPVIPPTQPPSQMKLPPCPRCGNTMGPRPDAFSTGWFIFFLCCLGLVPGIVYYALRHDKVRCAACRAVQ